VPDDSLDGMVSRETAGTPGRPVVDSEHISLVGLVTVMLRWRYLIFAIAAVAALVTLVRVVGQEKTYTSLTTFIPQSARPTSNFAGLAQQFNINVDGGQAGQSPAFYVDLLRARAILEPVVDSQYTVVVADGRPRTANLVELLNVPNVGQPSERRIAAVALLRLSISANTAPRTGVIALAVTASSPTLAYQIANRLISELNHFNLVSRQSQASAERRFAEQRLAEVRAELRQAEDRLQEFLQNNRDYGRSPQLMLQHDRIMRDVDLRQQMQLTLAQSYERAKIDEVRDTPVITVIDQPDLPVNPDARGRIRKIAVSFFVGAVLGVILAFVLEYFSEAELREAEQHSELAALRRQAVQDLKRPWGSVRRAFRGTPE
jgi:uncharacterized protein involved in exopolysaccharide biosynthesis